MFAQSCHEYASGRVTADAQDKRPSCFVLLRFPLQSVRGVPAIRRIRESTPLRGRSAEHMRTVWGVHERDATDKSRLSEPIVTPASSNVHLKFVCSSHRAEATLSVPDMLLLLVQGLPAMAAHGRRRVQGGLVTPIGRSAPNLLPLVRARPRRTSTRRASSDVPTSRRAWNYRFSGAPYAGLTAFLRCASRSHSLEIDTRDFV